MKAENWIIGTGAISFLVMLGFAMAPDDFSSREAALPTAAGPGQAMTVAAPVTGQTAAADAQGAGLVPFSKAASEQFRGKVVRVVTLGNDIGWGQVHIWMDTGSGVQQEVSVAPDWYLQRLGCTIAENSRVQGVAYRFGPPENPGSELYARNIVVNGSSCTLRNDEGFALWADRLR
nr:Magnetosome protein MamS [uncultured bacterium]